MIAKRKGVAVRWGLKEAWKARANVQEPDLRRECRASGPMIVKPISSKDTKRKFGGCAWKAIELISGELLHVTDS